jgi:DNA-directed RNA polymerase subunit M/transcription elongation factor TFIIS
MKFCPRCIRWLEPESFGKNASRTDGLQDECRECKNARRRARSVEQKRDERLRWREANREKHLAQKALQKAVARGTLERPVMCDRCDSMDVEAHHPDYERRFDVEWLCPRCHGEVHAGWTRDAA